MISTEHAEGAKALGSVVVGFVFKTAAAFGAVSALAAGYASSGLPMPATQAYVAMAIGEVKRDIATLQVSNLELQRERVTARKGRLRFELAANGSLLPKAEPARRITLERRGEEIRDELADLDREDDSIRGRIEKLR